MYVGVGVCVRETVCVCTCMWGCMLCGGRYVCMSVYVFMHSSEIPECKVPRLEREQGRACRLSGLC